MTAHDKTDVSETGGAGVGRRGFLGALAGLSAGAGAALVAPGAVAPAAAQTTSREERTRARYQETEHVLRYYETNRY